MLIIGYVTMAVMGSTHEMVVVSYIKSYFGTIKLLNLK